MRIIVATLALLAALSLACKSSSSHGQTEPSDAFRQAAPAAAEQVLLTAADFPADWTSEPPDPDDDFDFQLEGECAELNLDEFPGQVADAESDEFTSPRDDSVQSFAIIFAGEDSAADGMESLELLNECSDEFIEALRLELLQTAADEAGTNIETIKESVNIDVGFEELETLGFTDDSYAFRLSFDMDMAGLRFLVTGDLFIERYGGMIGGVTYATVGSRKPEREEAREYMELVMTRMGKAYDALPE
jgi:hypothetical protein